VLAGGGIVLNPASRHVSYTALVKSLVEVHVCAKDLDECTALETRELVLDNLRFVVPLEQNGNIEFLFEL
jgi:hypothetical protein